MNLSLAGGFPLLPRVWKLNCEGIREFRRHQVQLHAVILQAVWFKYLLVWLPWDHPIGEVEASVLVEVQPELVVGAIFDAGIGLVVQTIQSTAYNIVQLVRVYSINFQPLAMLDKFENVSPSADAVRKSAGCVSGQT